MMNRRKLLAYAFLLSAISPLQGSEETLVITLGCAGCHMSDGHLVGPSYSDIAERYRGQDVAVDLAAKVKEGSQGGVWGDAPMPPIPAPETDVLAVVKWMLTNY